MGTIRPNKIGSSNGVVINVVVGNPKIIGRVRVATAAAIFLFHSLTLAQSGPDNLKHFSQAGLSFDYSADWSLTDKSTPTAQHLVLFLPSTSLMVMIIAYRDLLSSRDQLVGAHQQLAEPCISNLVEKLSNAKAAAKRELACTKISNQLATGVRVRGMLNDQPSTAEVFSFGRERRFVTVVYVRYNADEARGSKPWDVIRDSFRLEPRAKLDGSDDLDVMGGNIVVERTLNAKARSLPTPAYPAAARGARASGAVAVEVTIDESGKVVSAVAKSGHQLLRKAAEDVAKEARFSPTIMCGYEIKVVGTIIYNFIPY